MDIDVDINSDSKIMLIINFNNMFCNLINLRHQDNSFNTFLDQEWYLYNFFTSTCYWDYFLLNSINWLNLSLNLIIDISLANQFLLTYNFILYNWYFYNLFSNIWNLNYFLLNSRYINNFLMNWMYFYDFINKFINNFKIL